MSEDVVEESDLAVVRETIPALQRVFDILENRDASGHEYGDRAI
jgi:hypothetical protein